MTSKPFVNARPRRLRAAHTTARHALSSLLRLARPTALDGLSQQLTFGAQALLRTVAAPR